MSTELEKRIEEMEAEIVVLNEKALFLLMTCLTHAKEINIMTDILEEMVVDKPEEKDMMAALADDIEKATSSTRTSPLT